MSGETKCRHTVLINCTVGRDVIHALLVREGYTKDHASLAVLNVVPMDCEKGYRGFEYYVPAARIEVERVKQSRIETLRFNLAQLAETKALYESELAQLLPPALTEGVDNA
jgi:hypothetical protein